MQSTVCMHILRLPVHNWLYKGIQQQWKWCSFFYYCSLDGSCTKYLIVELTKGNYQLIDCEYGSIFHPDPQTKHVIREQSYIEMQFNQPKNVISHLKYHMIDTFPCCSHLQSLTTCRMQIQRGRPRRSSHVQYIRCVDRGPVIASPLITCAIKCHVNCCHAISLGQLDSCWCSYYE